MIVKAGQLYEVIPLYRRAVPELQIFRSGNVRLKGNAWFMCVLGTDYVSVYKRG
jgi:hypothetical protein